MLAFVIIKSVPELVSSFVKRGQQYLSYLPHKVVLKIKRDYEYVMVLDFKYIL